MIFNRVLICKNYVINILTTKYYIILCIIFYVKPVIIIVVQMLLPWHRQMNKEKTLVVILC